MKMATKDIPIPKDLGIKIGNDKEVFWNDLKLKCEKVIFSAKREIEIQENIVKLAEFKLKEEKLK